MAPTAPAVAGPAPAWLRVLLPVVVATAAFVTFLPALNAGFVNWDDDKLFLTNSEYRGLSRDHISWMFRTTKMGHWQPLSWMTLGLDHVLWGTDPMAVADAPSVARRGLPLPAARGYHLTNMVLHAGCALAFYFLAVRLLVLSVGSRNRPSGLVVRVAAALAALFFAVHPLRVESVAWITERRDLLSGLFFVLTVNLYLKSRTAGAYRPAWYLGALAVFGLSVLSKAWGMTMPAVLLVLDFYPLRRLGGRVREWFSPRRTWVWLEKLPFAVIAYLIALKAIDAQQGQVDTAKSLAEHALEPRMLQMFYGAAFYTWKTLLPFDLIPLYELHPIQQNPFALRFVVSLLAVCAAVFALVVLRRRWPAGPALGVVYLAIYSPVSGIAQSGPQLVKDSYSYLCCLSWAVLLGGGLLWCYRRRGPRWFVGCAGFCAVWVGALAVLSRHQTGIWHDSRALWTHTLEIDDSCSMAHNNLAIMLRHEGKHQEAIRHYQRSIEVSPDVADTHFNLGNCHKALKQHGAAIESYKRAIELQKTVRKRPIHEQALVNLGNTYLAIGNLESAVEHHRRAARVKRAAGRSNPELCNLLGRNLLNLAVKREGPEREAALKEAEQHLRLAIHRKPDDPTALCNLAEVLIELGRCEEAGTFLERTLEVKPDARRPGLLYRKAEAKCGQ